MTTKKYSKKNTLGVMDNAGKWSSLSYVLNIKGITLKAIIPQRSLTKHGKMPKAMTWLLRNPSQKNRKKLFLEYGVVTHLNVAMPPARDIAEKIAA